MVTFPCCQSLVNGALGEIPEYPQKRSQKARGQDYRDAGSLSDLKV